MNGFSFQIRLGETDQFQFLVYRNLKGGVHGSAHVHESKYFFVFARYDPSLFNLIRCL